MGLTALKWKSVFPVFFMVYATCRVASPTGCGRWRLTLWGREERSRNASVFGGVCVLYGRQDLNPQ